MFFIEFACCIRNNSFHRKINLKSCLLSNLLLYFNIKLLTFKNIFYNWCLSSNNFLFYFFIRFKCNATFLKFLFFFKIVWLALLTDFQCFKSHFNSLYVRSSILFQWAISHHVHIRVEKKLYQWNRVRWFDQFITLHENVEIIARFYLRSVLTRHLSTVDILFQSFHWSMHDKSKSA